MKLDICVGMVAAGVEDVIIDLIWASEGDFAASGSGKACNMGEGCG